MERKSAKKNDLFERVNPVTVWKMYNKVPLHLLLFLLVSENKPSPVNGRFPQCLLTLGPCPCPTQLISSCTRQDETSELKNKSRDALAFLLQTTIFLLLPRRPLFQFSILPPPTSPPTPTVGGKQSRQPNATYFPPRNLFLTTRGTGGGEGGAISEWLFIRTVEEAVEEEYLCR